MYAVIRTGGKQYRVSEGEILRVESLAGERGDTITFDDVLMIGNDEIIQTREEIANSQVGGIIVNQDRGRKIRVFKKKRRKNYVRTRGHRQNYTEIKIQSITP
jgi:large subunit ribosomal protein L21